MRSFDLVTRGEDVPAEDGGQEFGGNGVKTCFDLLRSRNDVSSANVKVVMNRINGDH